MTSVVLLEISAVGVDPVGGQRAGPDDRAIAANGHSHRRSHSWYFQCIWPANRPLRADRPEPVRFARAAGRSLAIPRAACNAGPDLDEGVWSLNALALT